MRDPFGMMEDFQRSIHSRFGFGFGGGFHDDFFSSKFDPFSEMRSHESMFGGFEDMRQLMSRGSLNNPRGNYVCQSYQSSTVIGPDGKPVTEKIVRNETGKVGSDGRQIREKNELYNHTGNDIKRVTRERGLGDQRVVVTREINQKERNDRRDLFNIEENEVETFNRQWSDVAQKEHLPEIRYDPFGNGQQRTRQLRLKN